MKCFYAPTEDAIGLCKSCGRGLSLAHCTEYPEGLACKDRCEKATLELIELTQGAIQNRRATRELMKRPGTVPLASGIFLLALGGIFIYQFFAAPWGASYFMPAGIAFLIYGVVQVLRGIRLNRSTRAK